jgi:hypothetical protein
LVSAWAVGVAGCAGTDDPNAWYNKTVVENFGGRSDGAGPAEGRPDLGNPNQYPAGPPPYPASQNQYPASPNPYPANANVYSGNPNPAPVPAGRNELVPDNELYRSDGSCGGLTLGAGSAFRTAPGDPISLEMTECDVARRAGPPDKIEIAANARGERFLTMTYVRGERPRIFRFASGRLVGIEALPSPARARR